MLALTLPYMVSLTAALPALHFCHLSSIGAGPADHCRFHAFGQRDERANPDSACACPCGHDHVGSCRECADVHEYPLKFGNARTRLLKVSMLIDGGSVTTSRLHLIEETVTYLQKRNKHYCGHQARLCNESLQIVAVMKDLEANHHKIYIDFDYAMRFLPLSYRETMVEFFGKKGITWHGVRVVWYNPTLKRHCFYLVNQICTDSKEDGQLSCGLISNIVKRHRDEFGDRHTICLFTSDGAGAFSGEIFLLRITYIFAAYGMKVESHHTGEAGGGKGLVDVNFACEKKEAGKQVLRGQGAKDINDARSLVICMNVRKKPHTVNYEVEFNRDKLKPGGTKITGMQSASFRVFVYDERTRLPIRILCYNQSGLNSKPDSIIEMAGRWDETLSADRILNVAVGWADCPLPSSNLALLGSSSIESPSTLAHTQTATVSSSTTTTNTSSGSSSSSTSGGGGGGGSGSVAGASTSEALGTLGTVKIAGTITLAAQKKAEKLRIKEAVRLRHEKLYAANQLYAPADAWICCPKPGCNRQFSLPGRLQQHLTAANCSYGGSAISAPSTSCGLHPCDGMSIKDMTIRFMDEQYRSASTVVDGVRCEDDGRSYIAQSLHAQAVTAVVDVNITSSCPFGWAKRTSLTHPKITADQISMIRWAWQYGEKDGNTKISQTQVIRLMRVIGLAHSDEGAKYAGETLWQTVTLKTGGLRLFDDDSMAGVLEEWWVGLVYQTISTEKRHVERVQAGRRTLNGTEYRRELVHFLSAITTIGEDGAPELDKQRLIKPNPFLTWPHSLSFEAMADVLMNTYDVKTKYATFKQQDIKHDKDTFGPNRKYWSLLCDQCSQSGWNESGTASPCSSCRPGWSWWWRCR